MAHIIENPRKTAARLNKLVEKLKNTNETSSNTLFRSVLLGHLIGYDLPLPSSSLKAVDSHFMVTYADSIGKYAYEVNEYAIIDPQAAIRAARMTWMHRYDLVYKPLARASVQSTFSTMSASASVDGILKDVSLFSLMDDELLTAIRSLFSEKSYYGKDDC